MAAQRRILHLHGSFDLGGKEARAVRLMNAFGDAARHVVLSADPEAFGARAAIRTGIDAEFPGETAPALHGLPGPGRYIDLARYMADFDLVLSYNWGSMDGVMAHRLLSMFMTLPPLIHHEDGFNEEERIQRKRKRDLFRRLALPTARHVMVPSQVLRDVALNGWGCSDRQVVQFDNGIALADYGEVSAPPPIPKASDDVWVGTIAGLRDVKNLPAMVRALALAGDERLHLVIAGEGPARPAIEAEAVLRGVRDRVHLLGFCPRPADIVPHFDIFALSSHSEQQPIGLIEAMATGLSAACFGVGDIPQMVAPDNAPFIVQAGDEKALAAAFATLAEDPARRTAIGHENRERAITRFGEAGMIERFRLVYGEAMGLTDFALQ